MNEYLRKLYQGRSLTFLLFFMIIHFPFQYCMDVCVLMEKGKMRQNLLEKLC